MRKTCLGRHEIENIIAPRIRYIHIYTFISSKIVFHYETILCEHHTGTRGIMAVSC